MVRQKLHAQLGEIGAALQDYASAHHEFPRTLDPLVSEKIVHPSSLRNPLARRHASDLSDFVYVAQLRQDDPPRWPILFDREDADSNRRAVLLLSGEARTISSTELQQMLTQFIAEFRETRGRPPEFVPNMRSY